jgi:hypothetical protein
VFSLIRSLGVVSHKPRIQINLKLFDGSIELLSEGDAIKLVLDCTIQTFANTVGLRMICLSSCVLNIIERQEELIVMRVLASAILGAPIGENTKQWHLVLLKKWQHSVITSSLSPGYSKCHPLALDHATLALDHATLLR